MRKSKPVCMGIMASAALVLLIGLLSACGSDDDAGWGPGGKPDVSHSGQVAYACALAEHVQAEHGSADSWSETIGDDANPGVRESAAVSSLLGGTAGFVLPDHKQLSELGERLAESVMKVDIDDLESSLDGIVDLCDDVSGADDADVSHSAQITYACGLIDYVQDEHGSDADEWEKFGQDRAWHEVTSAAALVGSLNGQELPDHEELSKAGKTIYQGMTRVKSDLLQESIDDFASACGAT